MTRLYGVDAKIRQYAQHGFCDCLLCAFRAANYLTSLSLAWWVSDMQDLTTQQYVRITLVRDNRIVLTFIRLVCMLGWELQKLVSFCFFGSCLCRRHSC